MRGSFFRVPRQLLQIILGGYAVIRQKSKLTLVLKVYSVLALIYSIISCIRSFIPYVIGASIPSLYVGTVEQLFLVVVNCILVIIIFRRKGASSLFLPCLLAGITSIMWSFAFIVINMITPIYTNIWGAACWKIIQAVIFFLIAVDSKNGLKYALPEAITLAAFIGISAIRTLLRTYLQFDGYASMEMTILLKNMEIISFFQLLNLVFSSTAVIILFLWSSYVWQTEAVSPASQINQNVENNS